MNRDNKISLKVRLFAVTTILLVVLLLTLSFNTGNRKNTENISKKTQLKIKNVLTSNDSSIFTIVGENNNQSLIEISNDYYREIPTLTSLPSGESLGLNSIKIDLFKNRRDYTKETAKPNWSEGYADYKNSEIYLINNSNMINSTLPHEISHLFFDSYVGYENKEFNWIDEGLASLVQVNYDKDQAKSLNTSMESIRSGNYIPLGSLSKFNLEISTNKQDINIFYAQSLSIVSYLMTDTNKWKNFLSKLKSHYTTEEALIKIYDYNYQSLGKNWLLSIKTSKQSWERLH